jgi:uncharacterized lipoprotein YddW (UPF0748 family)
MFASCENKPSTPAWEWPDDDDNDDDDEPGAEKPRYIWVDAGANFPDFANSRENIARDLKLAADTGFTDVVIDVRPTTGDVLFKTDVVQQVEWLGAWMSTGYTRVERTASWDYLQAFIDEGHKLGMRVHAAINTFTGGNTTSLGNQGVLFRDGAKSDWATMLNTADGIVDIISAGNNAKFFNPVNDNVQKYLCDLLSDLAAYDVDGIILDRCRFDGYRSDFSNYTRTRFETFLGSKVSAWPGDVMPAGGNSRPDPQPTHYKKWLEFRAKTIHDFIVRARETVKKVNPDVKFGVYVGGWYSAYEDVGVNWGSPRYDTGANFPAWASTNYKNYGYADHCDQMLIGAYAAPNRVYGTGEWTMQGFCSKAMAYTMNDCPTVAGGPDVGNWTIPSGWNEAQVNDAITASVKACMDACDGYFLFDMIHLKQTPSKWPAVKAGIDLAVE